MSAIAALEAARVAGIDVAIDGEDLVLEASAPPPAEVLDLLSRHKTGIVALLSPRNDGWSAEDWQVFFDERAAIVEVEGGLPPRRAEASAFACCVAEWLNRNPVRSAPDRCLGSGGNEHPRDRLLPHTNTDGAGHAGCTRAVGRPGTPAGRPKRSRPWRAWGSRRHPNSQTISGKTETRDGWLGIGPS